MNFHRRQNFGQCINQVAIYYAPRAVTNFGGEKVNYPAALAVLESDILRKTILQQAIQGKLSEQLPTDDDARALAANYRR